MQGRLADPDRRVGPDLVVASPRADGLRSQHPDPVGHPGGSTLSGRAPTPARSRPLRRPSPPGRRARWPGRSARTRSRDRAAGAFRGAARSRSRTAVPSIQSSPANTPPAVSRVARGPQTVAGDPLPAFRAPPARRRSSATGHVNRFGGDRGSSPRGHTPQARVLRAWMARSASSPLRRVADLFQGQSTRRQHRHRRVADRALGHRRQPGRVAPTGTDLDQRAHHRPHHRMAERVGAHGHLDHAGERTGRNAFAGEVEQGPDRRPALAAAAEGPKSCSPSSPGAAAFSRSRSRSDFSAG